MPLFIHPKRHIIGPRRVGYPGHWPQSRGQGEQWGQMKGNVIMGQRQKETLSPNNYFGGKGGEGRIEGGSVEIKKFSLASYVLIASPVPPCEAEEPLWLAEAWTLSDGDWLRPAGTGSDSTVPTVPPLWEKDWSTGGVMTSVCVCVRYHRPHIFIKNPCFYSVGRHFSPRGSVFLHTTEALWLWPLTLRQPEGLCLSDLTCSYWPNDHLTLCFSNSWDPLFILSSAEIVRFQWAVCCCQGLCE